jgi:hypothetical protein
MTRASKIQYNTYFIILIISLFAFFVRIWGSNFGLPYEYHVDEVQYVRQAASMGENGLEPAVWNNPPFFKYLLLVEYGLLYVFGKIFGFYSSPAEFGSINTFDPSLLYILGRGTNAFFGALTVLLVGITALSFFNKKVAVISAWFLAVCFIHVRDAHFAVNDIFTTLLVSITLFASLKIYYRSGKLWYIVAGISLGLGFATKYTAVLAVISFLLGHFLSDNIDQKNASKPRFSWLILTFLAAAFSAIVASPYFILSARKVFYDIYNSLYLPGQLGFDGWQIDPHGAYIYYITSMFWGLGWGMLLLVFIAIVVAVFQKSKVAAIILAYPILLYIMMGRQQMYFARFMIPAIPSLILWTAVVLDDIVSKWFSDRRKVYILFLIVLVLTIQPLIDSFRLGFLLQKEDTRSEARTWVENNIPAGSKIALDWPFYGPSLSTKEKKVPNSAVIYDVVTVGGTGLDTYPVSWYKENGFDYLITSSFISNIRLESEQKQEQREQFYSSLDTELTLLKQVTPIPNEGNLSFGFDEIYGPAISLWERERPGPILKIYKVSQ